MFKILLVCVVVFTLLITSEYLWRVKHHRSEITRKFVHISVGTFVASWPFFLSWHMIELLSVAFLIIVSLSKLLSIFGSIHSIERKTRGEALFAVGVGLTALISHNKWIFMVAVLHLSLADGLAAILGTKYGMRRRYEVFKHAKTIIGSLTFCAVSAIILSTFILLHGPHTIWPIVIWLPLLTMLIENIGIQGVDNLLVPITVAAVLRLLI